MIYAGILAGGTGTRMGIQEMPKQFLPLGNKPIIMHTVEKFLFVPDIDRVYVAVHPNWISYFGDLLQKFVPSQQSKVVIVSGGNDRNDSIMNIILDIQSRPEASEQDILITHDAVRPFVSYRMIMDNISAMKEYDVADTVVLANDTIVESVDGNVITTIPDRKHMYQGQTPQTFKVQAFLKMYEAMEDSVKKILTDACKVFVLNGTPVSLVKGEYSNIKITTVTDLKIAQAMIGDE